MSVIHNMFGPSRLKSRFTRSVDVSLLIMFRRPLRRFGSPLMPCSRMIARTSFLFATWSWASASSACTRRHP
ncbi:MAG: hypothetical protein ACI83Y_000295 [Candidatus Azotimanducaceae bacterium]|jgi:hypothetical protein